MDNGPKNRVKTDNITYTNRSVQIHTPHRSANVEFLEMAKAFASMEDTTEVYKAFLNSPESAWFKAHAKKSK